MAKKKVDSDPKTRSTLEIAKKAIIKKYGSVISTMGEKGDLIIDTVSTGSLGLDVAVGRGGLARGRIYEFYGPPSGGKCQSKDSYLNTQHGLLTIEELFSLYGTPVCVADKNTKCSCGLLNKDGQIEETSHFVWSGNQEVKKITTSAGFETESTGQHKYKVIDSDTGLIVWRRTKDIKIGDCILISKSSYDIDNDKISEDEAAFLGMLVADEQLNGQDKVLFDSSVPIKIRKSSNKVISKFLSSYFSSNCCCGEPNRITASGVSHNLMRQLQLLLLGRFGIKSIIKIDTNGTYGNSCYYIEIYDEDVVTFMIEIGFVLDDKVNKFVDFNLKKEPMFNKWNYPYQDILLKVLYADVEGVDSKSYRSLSYDIDRCSGGSLSIGKLNTILGHLTLTNLEIGGATALILYHLCELSKYACDKVSNVEDVGIVPVFDVVMPETHSFVSNGFISHNTTLAMSVMAQAQKRKMLCCFVDAEHAADPTLFRAMDVDIDKVEMIQAYVGDDNLDALEMYMKTGELDVAVVDSVSALIPKAESEAEISDDFMGLLARLMSKAMRRFVPIASETNTLLIFINQLRYKIGAYGDPRITTGGEAIGFYATGRISVSGGEAKSSRIVNPITGETIGHKTTFEIRKNKLAPPFRTAEIPLIYGVGYDIHSECLTLAEGLGLVEKRGAYYYKPGVDKFFAQGEIKAIEVLRENEELYRYLRDGIIEMTGLKSEYEQNS